MVASDHLSSQQFFHGTDHPFSHGDVINPNDRPEPERLKEGVQTVAGVSKWRSAAGHYMTDEEHRTPQFYFTTSKPLAGAYGQHVLKVEPLDDYEPDPYSVFKEAPVFRTKGKVRVAGIEKSTF